jgi:hypothetical protein
MDEKLDTLIDKLSLLLIAPVDKKTNFTFKRTATALKSSNESKPIIIDNNNNTKKNTNKIIQKECDDKSSTKCSLLLKNVENPSKKYESKVMVMPNNIADEVKIIHGIPLAADLKSNYYLKLDSNNGQQPLTIMDLEKEGLSEYLPYIKNPSNKTNQVVSFNNHISVSSLNSSNSTTTTTSSSSSSSRSYKSVRSNNKSINSCPILKNKITKTKSDPQSPKHTITNNNKSTNNKKDVIKQVSFKELNNNNNISRYSISTIAENIFINPIDKSTPLPSTPLPPPLNYVLSKISSLHNQNNTLDTVPNTPAAYSTPIPNIREQQTPELVLPVVSLPPLPLPMSKTPPTKSIIIPKSINNKSKLVTTTTTTLNFNSKPPSPNKTQGDTSLKQVSVLKLFLYFITLSFIIY